MDPADDDPRTFNIFSGLKELKLRAPDETTKLSWLKVLKHAQSTVSSQEETVEAIRRVLQRAREQQIPDDEAKFFLTEGAASALNGQITRFFELQAVFCSQLSALKATALPEQKQVIGKLADSSAEMKKLISESGKLLREERDKLVVVQEIFRRKISLEKAVMEKSHSLRVTLQQILEEHKTSPENDDSQFFSVLSQVENLEILEARGAVPSTETATSQTEKVFSPTLLLIEKSPVFREFPIVEGSQRRKKMPAARIEVKLDVWGLLKNNVGKDLSRIAMPISLNDPISMLQKPAEMVEFCHFLRKANRCSDAGLRLCYLTAFTFSVYPHTVNRLKKPFNPLLGETYELFYDDIRFVSEQVSHHPPVTAFYCDAEDFVVQGSFTLRTNISLAGFQVSPVGPVVIELRKTGERFTFTRPKSTLHNLIIGQMYIWHSGESAIVERGSGARSLLFFKPKGWGSRHDYECEGKVTDSTGRTTHHLYGKWNAFLTAVAVNDKTEMPLVEAEPPGLEASKNYFFSEFQMNLNLLTPEMLHLLPQTDSRFRPDQRAYEYGNLELAAAEKLRLEERQRIRRRMNESNGEKPKPRWFVPAEGEDLDYRFTGDYFAARDSRRWPEDLPDLFN